MITIAEQIAAASFFENLAYSKELSRMKSEKAASQIKETNKIRKLWIELQQKRLNTTGGPFSSIESDVG